MRRTILLIAALTLALTACTSSEPATTTTGARGGVVGGSGLSSGGASGGLVHLVQGALVRFDACADFLDHVKAEAVERVGPYGLDWWGGWPIAFADDAFMLDGVAAAPRAVEEGAAGGGADHSTTNNQESGVDEADIVKSDGRRIVTITNNILSVIDVSGAVPQMIGTLRVPGDTYVSDMFLRGDTIVLLGNTWRTIGFHDQPTIGAPEPAGDAIGIAPDYYGSPIVTMTEVDISGEPSITRTLQVDGSYLSSRMIDGVARVVVTAGPTGFVWAYPEGGGLRAERAAVEANKKIVEESTIENWVPYYVLTDADGNVISEGAAVSCDRAHHPVEFGGFNTLNILAIDLDSGLDIVDSTSVLASGETVYSSTNAMYVATNAWMDPRVFAEDDWAEDPDFLDEARTQIHQFDITGSTTEYVATGSVRGYLLNQFAMSEHNGDLRVASTTSPDWWGGRAPTQESLVSVLRPSDGELEVVGEIDGLGKDERIYSVRFMGDTAYLVTFRQVDPLFTIDLSDPENPSLRGELKIPGYSSYLHPLGEGLVLGIGQDATDEGRIRGSQVSLFDVSDLDNPTRIAQLRLGKDSNSTAEYDHRAFLQWGDTVVVPITSYNWNDEKSGFFTGAVAIDTSDGDLDELSRLAHPDGDDWEWGWNSAILRSLVVGDSLYTVSNAGLMKSSLDTFETIDFLEFNAA